MHEMAITQNLLDMVLDFHARAGAGRVTAVHVAVGERANIVAEPMQLYWTILSTGSPAEGSHLHIRRIRARFECRDCGTRFELGRGSRCQTCAGTRLRVVAGDDVKLETVDVAVPAAERRK